MGKVIQFRTPESRVPESREDKIVAQLLKISDEIDEVITSHIVAGNADPKDLAGLLAHRLGTLMRSIEEKSELWDVCEKVLKKQAAID